MVRDFTACDLFRDFSIYDLMGGAMNMDSLENLEWLMRRIAHVLKKNPKGTFEFLGDIHTEDTLSYAYYEIVKHAHTLYYPNYPFDRRIADSVSPRDTECFKNILYLMDLF
jgi:hypothetical protein